MNQELFVQLAMAAGFQVIDEDDSDRQLALAVAQTEDGPIRLCVTEELHRFAALVADECAKELDEEVRALIGEGAARKVGPWRSIAWSIRAKFKVEP